MSLGSIRAKMQCMNRCIEKVLQQRFIIPLLLLSLSQLSACSQIISNARQAFAKDLSETIIQYDDPETIQKALPAYLVLISSMIKGDPDNADLLFSGAKLYSAYASVFVEPGDSQRALSKRAFEYASRGLCLEVASACQMSQLAFADFTQQLTRFETGQAGLLFVYGSAWTGLIQANSSDWNRIAQLPRVKAIMHRVIELDEAVEQGTAYLYLAVMETLLPPGLGGKPELAKKYFEKAEQLSAGNNLMVKVLYAEKYARLLFDRELHDRLLTEVINKPLGETGGSRLMNVLAKQKARALMNSANEYF